MHSTKGASAPFYFNSRKRGVTIENSADTTTPKKIRSASVAALRYFSAPSAKVPLDWTLRVMGCLWLSEEFGEVPLRSIGTQTTARALVLDWLYYREQGRRLFPDFSFYYAPDLSYNSVVVCPRILTTVSYIFSYDKKLRHSRTVGRYRKIFKPYVQKSPDLSWLESMTTRVRKFARPEEQLAAFKHIPGYVQASKKLVLPVSTSIKWSERYPLIKVDTPGEIEVVPGIGSLSFMMLPRKYRKYMKKDIETLPIPAQVILIR